MFHTKTENTIIYFSPIIEEFVRSYIISVAKFLAFSSFVSHYLEILHFFFFGLVRRRGTINYISRFDRIFVQLRISLRNNRLRDQRKNQTENYCCKNNHAYRYTESVLKE